MRLGATAAYTYAYRGTGMTLEDYLDSIATLPTLGITRFDLEILQEQHVSIYESPRHIALLQAALKEHGVSVAGFTAWACLGLIHTTDPARHERGYALFERIAAIASDLGAAYIHLGSDMIQEYIVSRDQAYVTAPATAVAIPPEVKLGDVLDAYAGRLAGLASIAQRRGLKFAFEPRANSLVCSADSFLDIHRRAGHENLYACLDVVHCAYHREDVPLAIEKLGRKLLVMQLCNAADGAMIHRPVSDGPIDVPAILRALGKTGFDGFVMLELYRGGRDEKAEVDQWYRQGAHLVAAAGGV